MSNTEQNSRGNIAAHYSGQPPFEESELQARWTGDGGAVNTCNQASPGPTPDERAARLEVIERALREDLGAAFGVSASRVNQIANLQWALRCQEQRHQQEKRSLGDPCENTTKGIALWSGNRDVAGVLVEIAGRLKEAEAIAADVCGVLDALLSGPHITVNVYKGPKPASGVEAPTHSGLKAVLHVLRDRFIYQVKEGDINPCQDFKHRLDGGKGLIPKPVSTRDPDPASGASQVFDALRSEDAAHVAKGKAADQLVKRLREIVEENQDQARAEGADVAHAHVLRNLINLAVAEYRANDPSQPPLRTYEGDQSALIPQDKIEERRAAQAAEGALISTEEIDQRLAGLSEAQQQERDRLAAQTAHYVEEQAKIKSFAAHCRQKYNDPDPADILDDGDRVSWEAYGKPSLAETQDAKPAEDPYAGERSPGAC